MTIQINKNLHLRPLEYKDAASIAKYADNIKIWINLTDIFPNPYSLNDALQFIEMQQKIIPPQVFAIIYFDEAIGTTGLSVIQEETYKRGDLGYWIGEPFWNNGIMTNVVKQMTEFGFNTYPDISEISAFVFKYNPASAKVLIKAGYFKNEHMNKSIMKGGKKEELISYTFKRNM